MKESCDIGEEEQPGGALYHAFIYLTVFFLFLVVVVQFNPFIQYRYPMVLLVIVLTVLFVVVSIKDGGEIKTHKALSIIFLLIIAIPTGITLFLMLVSESFLLLLLIPVALVILFMERRIIHVYDQDEST